MATLLSGTSSLILLLGLLAGTVTTATARDREVSCHQQVHPELIRELWSRARQLLEILPVEEKPTIKARLLPKFCTKCSEKAIGWLEIREMIDIYQWGVFSQDEIKTLLPLHFPDLLFRLQTTLHNCVPNSQRSKWSRDIKKLRRKIKKRRDGAMRAVSEFMLLLRWTGELTHQRVF